MSLKEDLVEWQECQTKRKALEREAKTLADRESQLEEKFEAELKKSNKQSIIRAGFTLAWTAGRASVSWAAEYLKECGAEKANALKQSAANDAPKKLSITPPV